jgi:hypothetical protein
MQPGRQGTQRLFISGNAPRLPDNTFTDHKDVLAAAIRQVPARFRARVLVRADGAGASHDLVKHLLSMSSPRRKVLLTCGWMITAADEDAIQMVPAKAWKPGIAQDGTPEGDKHVAEITQLMSRAGNWPDGLRWIVRRVKPSRRQMRNRCGGGYGDPIDASWADRIAQAVRGPCASPRSTRLGSATMRDSARTATLPSATSTGMCLRVAMVTAPPPRQQPRPTLVGPVGW